MVQWFDPANSTGITPYENLGVLGKIGLILQNVADPNTIPEYNKASLIDQQQRERMGAQSALKQLASDPAFASLDPAAQYQQIAAITGDPSALAEFNASQVITPLQQQELALQREQLAIARQNANRTSRNPIQFIKGDDGSIYAADPSTGALAKITQGNPGGNVKPTVDSEKGRKLGNAILTDLNAVENLAFDEDGDVNTTVVGQGYVGDGRTFNQGLRRAVQNTLYLKSGATAPDSEIEATLKNYAPSALDTPLQARAKLNGLRQFAEDSIPAYAQQNSPLSQISGGQTGGWSIRPKGGQ